MLRRVRSELRPGDVIEIDTVNGHPGMILCDFRVRSRAQDEQELPVSVWPAATRRLDALLESAGRAAQAPEIDTSSSQTSELWWNRLFPEASEAGPGLRAVVGQDSEGTRSSSGVDAIAMQIVRDASAGIQSRDAGSNTGAGAGALHLPPAMAAVLRAIQRVLGLHVESGSDSQRSGFATRC